MENMNLNKEIAPPARVERATTRFEDWM